MNWLATWNTSNVIHKIQNTGTNWLATRNTSNVIHKIQNTEWVELTGDSKHVQCNSQNPEHRNELAGNSKHVQCNPQNPKHRNESSWLATRKKLSVTHKMRNTELEMSWLATWKTSSVMRELTQYANELAGNSDKTKISFLWLATFWLFTTTFYYNGISRRHSTFQRTLICSTNTRHSHLHSVV